ncbi:hypothetical protein ACEPAH_7101 [Sanghuangporus vaninii]
MAPPVPTTSAPAAQPAIDATTLATAVALALRQVNGGGMKKGVAPPCQYEGGKDYLDFRCEVLLYFKAYDSSFQDDDDKITFVLSYLKEGSAATWAENYVNEASSTGQFLIADTWKTFLKELDTSFVDPNRHQKAFEKLDGMRQKSISASEFLNDFDIKQVNAGLTKPEHDGVLIDKLKKALNAAVIDGVM